MYYGQSGHRKLAKVRDSKTAKFFNFLGLYFLYRFILVKLGYENPFCCVIKVTSRCGLNCSHCPWPKNQDREMTTAEVKEKIDQAYELGCKVITFEGGEPTLRSDLEELIIYAKNKKQNVILITNGQDDFSSYSADMIWVSVEGNKEVQEKIRGAGTYDKIIDNLRKCPEKKVCIYLTISRASQSIVEEIPKLFPRHMIWYGIMYPYADSRDAALSSEEVKLIAQKICQLKKKYRNILNSKSFLKWAGRKTCCTDWAYYLVYYDGHSEFGCCVKFLEPADCQKCNLAPYAEAYHALQAKPNAVLGMMKVAGLNFKKIFSRQ